MVYSASGPALLKLMNDLPNAKEKIFQSDPEEEDITLASTGQARQVLHQVSSRPHHGTKSFDAPHQEANANILHEEN